MASLSILSERGIVYASKLDLLYMLGREFVGRTEKTQWTYILTVLYQEMNF